MNSFAPSGSAASAATEAKATMLVSSMRRVTGVLDCRHTALV
jgi:hypothetical protein